MSGYGVFARYYDRLTENVDYARRARYFRELILCHGGQGSGLLLDLACGTGSLSLELAGLGYEVIGADASADMLSAAMGKAASAERSILFLHQSMAELDLYGTVDYTVCALDSLNHLPDEAALAAAFDRVSLFTNPGGLFLFDLNTAYKHREILADNAYLYDLGDVFCAWQNSCHLESGRVDISLDFFERGKDNLYRRSAERFSEQVFARETVTRLLAESGMELLALYGDDSLQPPAETTQRLIYAARKQ